MAKFRSKNPITPDAPADDPYADVQPEAEDIAEKHFGHIAEPLEPKLNPYEKRLLTRYEGIVDRHQKDFYKAAMALARINKMRLYRETHNTFEEYVLERWGYKKTWAYKKIREAEQFERLSILPGQMPHIDCSSALFLLAGLSDEELINIKLQVTAEGNGGVLTTDTVMRLTKSRPRSNSKYDPGKNKEMV